MSRGSAAIAAAWQCAAAVETGLTIREEATVRNGTPSFTLGIEEEYLLVDPRTRDLADPPAGLMEAAKAKLGDRVTPEFMNAQIEIGTGICRTAADARAELVELRSTVAEIAIAHDCRLVAAATHPFANWQHQARSDKDRYHELKNDLQVVAERLLISGMHVHCGLEDDELRIDCMNQVRYFLPHLLALSTSSPFWHGHETGLRCYRLSVFDEMPRSGLPSQFASWGEYQGTLDLLAQTKIMEDPTKIWWDIRPHAKFPTLEMRICDVCTDVDDAVAIAALYACLCRMLWRLRQANQSWRRYPTFLIEENRWRAQRYGTGDSLIDLGRCSLVPFGDLLEEILQLVAEDADALGCGKEVAHTRTVLQRGTSAERQLADYGDGDERAFERVVDGLIARTVAF